MRIYRTFDKRKHLPLLLLADEQESMIENYIDKCEMYILEDNGSIVGEIAVCDVGNKTLEIKNLAVTPAYRHAGFGKLLIDFVCKKYCDNFRTVQVGTGDSPLTVPFYEKCGFKKFKVVENFFTDNYRKPIVECGITLKDMIYLKKDLRND